MYSEIPKKVPYGTATHMKSIGKEAFIHSNGEVYHTIDGCPASIMSTLKNLGDERKIAGQKFIENEYPELNGGKEVRDFNPSRGIMIIGTAMINVPTRIYIKSRNSWKTAAEKENIQMETTAYMCTYGKKSNQNSPCQILNCPLKDGKKIHVDFPEDPIEVIM